MMFMDTQYGDMTNKIHIDNIDLEDIGLTSLKGSPKECHQQFNCSNNNLTSLEYSPKLINDYFLCYNNFLLKNQRKQIIKYQIRAMAYYTDEGQFRFEDIQKEFEEYGKYLLKKEEKIQIKQMKNNKLLEMKMKNKKMILKNIDYGLSI